MPRRSIPLTGIGLAILLLVVNVSSASAATIPAADIGQNVGKMLSQWSGWILLPSAGLFGIAALFRRDVGHALTIAVIAIVVGIFVYAPSGAESAIKAIASSLTGSGR